MSVASPVTEFLFPSILLPKQIGRAFSTLLFNKLVLYGTDLLSEQTENQTLLSLCLGEGQGELSPSGELWRQAPLE